MLLCVFQAVGTCICVVVVKVGCDGGVCECVRVCVCVCVCDHQFSCIDDNPCLLCVLVDTC